MHCRRCGNKEFLEAIQYMKVKESKFALKGSEVKYIFCKKCGPMSRKNTDKEKREFYRASLACLAHHVLLKIKKYILS